MSIYNTEFEVKYNDIKEELLYKLTGSYSAKTEEATENKYEVNNPDEEFEYSVQDIVDVCDKLYRDELLSVFYADSIDEDKIDKGIHAIGSLMMQNPHVKQLADDLVAVIHKQMINELSTEEEKNAKETVLLSSLVSVATASFFRQETFSIWHKCICQQISTETIDEINLFLCFLSLSLFLFLFIYCILKIKKETNKQQMASTRNKNTPGNYCLEQRQNQGTERWQLYENGASGNAYDPRLAGNGFNPGKMSRDALSHNPISVESFLFGINSTNLVTPAPPLTPMLMCLSSANVFEHKPVIMPVPQAIRKNERPFPVP